jgi:hypothetical protein
MRVLALASACEAAVGTALLLDPSIALRLLIGVEASQEAAVVSRIAGIALLCLAIACWPNRGANELRPPLRAMLIYNAFATIYLGVLGIGGEWVGRLLWPAALLHAVFTAWCWFAIRRREAASVDPVRTSTAESDAGA